MLYWTTTCLTVNIRLIRLVRFTLQNGAVQIARRRSFPSLDLCYMQTNDIIFVGRVLSAQDMSVLLHRHVQRGQLLPLWMIGPSKSAWPLTWLQGYECSCTDPVGALTRWTCKVRERCQLRMLQEWRSFINLSPSFQLLFSSVQSATSPSGEACGDITNVVPQCVFGQTAASSNEGGGVYSGRTEEVPVMV